MAKLPIRSQRVRSKDRRNAPPKPKVAEDFYGSAAWKGIRERLRKERGGRCETPGCRSNGRVILHHIVERKDGGAPLDPRNLIFQCDPCHGAVTAANRNLRIDESHDRSETEGPEEARSSEAVERPTEARAFGGNIRLG